MVYDLTKEETAVLTSNSIEEQPVEKRLEVLNGVIRADFADKVTMADLDSERRIALGLHPEVQEELTQRQQQEQEILSPLENQLRQEMPYGATASVDGRDISVLDERKGWYREERHGREVEVGEIAVHPSPIEGKYKMTAVIDGQVITHEISQKDYDKFLAVDDYHRMKIFSKIFSEVDMKMRPEAQRSLGVKFSPPSQRERSSRRASSTACGIIITVRSSTASVSVARHTRISNPVSIRRETWPYAISRHR